MPAKCRTIPRQFGAVAHTRYPNLLAAGCSYTYNNSESCSVTWPYYLRDLAGFDQVWDCSQSSSGYNRAHTATVVELETNTALTRDNTLVVVMWSGNERVDITCERALAHDISTMPAPDLGWGLSTLGLSRQPRSGENQQWAQLSRQYHGLITSKSQALESTVALISLAGYLDSRGFDWVFLDWDDTRPTIRLPGMDPWAQGRFADVETLGSWATRTGQRIPGDGHPSPDAHLSWTRDCLIPYLIAKDHVMPSIE